MNNQNVVVNLSQVFTQMPSNSIPQQFASQPTPSQPSGMHHTTSESQDGGAPLRLSSWTFPKQQQQHAQQPPNQTRGGPFAPVPLSDLRRESNHGASPMASPISSRLVRNDSASLIQSRSNVNFVPDLQTLGQVSNRGVSPVVSVQNTQRSQLQPWGLSYASEVTHNAGQSYHQMMVEGQGVSSQPRPHETHVQHRYLPPTPVSTHTFAQNPTPLADVSRAERNLQMIRGSSPGIQDHSGAVQHASSRSNSRIVKVTRYSFDQNGNRKLIGEETIEQPIPQMTGPAHVQAAPGIPRPLPPQVPSSTVIRSSASSGLQGSSSQLGMPIRLENPSFVRGTEVPMNPGSTIMQNPSLPPLGAPMRISQSSGQVLSHQQTQGSGLVMNHQAQSISSSQISTQSRTLSVPRGEASQPSNLLHKEYKREADGNTYEYKTFQDPLGGTRVERRLAIDSRGQLCGIFKETGINMNDLGSDGSSTQNSINRDKQPEVAAEQPRKDSIQSPTANHQVQTKPEEKPSTPLASTAGFHSKSNQQPNTLGVESTQKDPGSVFTFKQQFDGSHQKTLLQNRGNLGSVARNLQEKENIPSGYESAGANSSLPQKLFGQPQEAPVRQQPHDAPKMSKAGSNQELASPIKPAGRETDPSTPLSKSAKPDMKDSQVADGLRGKTIKVRYKEYNGKTYPIGVYGDNLTKEEKEWLLLRVLDKEGFTIEEIEALEGGPLTDLEDGSEYRLTAEKGSEINGGGPQSTQKNSYINGTGGKSKASFMMSDEKGNQSIDATQYGRPGQGKTSGGDEGTVGQFNPGDQAKQPLNLMASSQSSNANSVANLGGLPPKPKSTGLAHNIQQQVINEAEDEEMFSQTSSAMPSQRRVPHSGQKIDLMQPPADDIWFRTKEQRVIEEVESNYRQVDMSKSSKKAVPHQVSADDDKLQQRDSEGVNIRFDYGSGKGYKPRPEDFESNERDTNGYDATDIDLLLRHNEDLLSRIKMDMKNIGESFVSATDMGHSRLRNNLSGLGGAARPSDFESKDMLDRSPIALQEFESFKTKTQDDRYYQQDKSHPLKSPQMPAVVPIKRHSLWSCSSPQNLQGGCLSQIRLEESWVVLPSSCSSFNPVFFCFPLSPRDISQ